MSYVVINGNKYDIPEFSFDTVCELEEYGVNLMGIDRNNPKLATIVRGLVAWIMGVDKHAASREIEAHIANGGDVFDIFNRTYEAMQKSGFFGRNNAKQPQDRKVKQYPGNQKKRKQGNNSHGNGSRTRN